ncbi:MAG: tRNA (guanosine(46)-N7)-methyltransferase TrmB [Alphaproteobacteria bacterium]|nr:tRNA (guanosine(46)-N7)-methyltransferase TrmB [Alphaproteobacteria bacterium]MBU2084662.1 tRNA (guanosine(46)-N7)-methyltransferase TrmB [Alphaproteobacteria bacterium]MBU2141927.1 tRNA (guanosine(46)-N7)-methyltransferase TrmB [Alphaproteobacteria bacterium]MBU2198375.1 tRNA (guanosine(46)-N7)-methyltransferase TrmB [Alphaproteobacteria bacterium]
MTSRKQDPSIRPIRTFGRKGGRPLSGRQQELIDNLLPRLTVPVGAAGLLDPHSLFPVQGPVCLEIGFGGGEHLIEQARRAPTTGFIGCEPFIEGMAKALVGVEDNSLTNVRLWMDDARALMDSLSDGCVDQVFILFPDPWPKKRQQKRRLVQPDFLQSLHRIMSPGAKVRFATDVASYADEALARFRDHGGFAWQAERASDWRSAPSDHVPTRYEAKRLGDCEPVWFDFRVQP